MDTFKLGDVVKYQGVQYIIEKCYGNDVYRVGNPNCFCDSVPGHLLELG